MKNNNGLTFKSCGNFLYVYHPNEAYPRTYIKWIHANFITKEKLAEDSELKYERGTRDYSRINKHGVEYLMNGVMFQHEGLWYYMKVPQLLDLSHIYTPEMLLHIWENCGVYDHHSRRWRKTPVKPIPSHINRMKIDSRYDDIKPNAELKKKFSED